MEVLRNSDAPSRDAPRQRGRRIPAEVLAVTALATLWVITLGPFLAVGADNARLVAAYNTDGAMLLNLVSRMLKEHSFRLVFGAYGHLYFNVTLAILKWLGPVSDLLIVETMRGISVACGAGVLLFTFSWARRLYGSTSAWVALVLVASNQIVYAWSGMIHPDMLQAVLLMGALYYTARSFDHPTTANVLLASALAGLAFATKYSGLFVLPLIAAAALGRSTSGRGRGAAMRLLLTRSFLAATAITLLVVGFTIDANWIVTHLTSDGHIDVPLMLPLDTVVALIRACGLVLAVAVVLPWPWQFLRNSHGISTVMWGFAVSTATFVLVFAVTSPYSLLKLAFVKGLYFEATETGAMMSVAWVQEWIHGIIGAMGWPIVVPCAGTAAWLLWRRRLHPLSSVEIVFLSWIALYLAVLLAPFHEMLFHYTLPMIPPAAILGAHGIVAACETIGRRTHLDRRVPAAVVAMAIVILSVMPGIDALIARRERSLHRMDAANIVVGDWLSHRLPASSSIAYDSLTYIPPRFTNIFDTWGGTRSWLAQLNPDVVVVNRAIENTWKDNPGSAEYYRCLEDETCGYERVFVLDEVSVYQREACGGPPDVDGVFRSNDTK